MLTGLAWITNLAGFKFPKWALIAGAFVVAMVLINLGIGRVKRAGEKTGRLAEALATSRTTQEIKEVMTDAVLNRPGTDGASIDWLRRKRPTD